MTTLSLILVYIMASIPFGMVYTTVFVKRDVRAHGSGSIGATNVFRVGGVALALVTVLSDFLKGYASLWFVMWLQQPSWVLQLAGIIAVAAHIFPVWLRFKGGKGVATALGVFAAFSPVMTLNMILLWLLALWYYRISSVASLLVIVSAPMLACIYGTPLIVSIVIALLILVSHRNNIQRLVSGEEDRVI